MRRAELKQVFDSLEFEREFHTNEPLGSFLSDSGTRFALWAPTASRVALSLYTCGADGAAFETIAMKRGERGVWFYETSRNLSGVYYDYLVTAQRATRRTADPYARACGVNGNRSMVVDLAKTNPEGFADDRAPAKQAEDVIYEIHVKDFSWDPASGVPFHLRGKYGALALRGTTLGGEGRMPTCLDHMLRLGVTHVQLMPVYDYGSVDETGASDAFNWGYDPVNYNIPDGSYSTDPAHGEVRIREFKEAVMGLHKAGLRVIMDVVYNHTYHLESHLFKTVPWYYVRQKADGAASNGSGCGCETASERSMCGRYILDSVLYWAEEYHIDGFRFDLMGLHDTELMNAVQQALDARFGAGEKLVYGEPWAGGTPHPREGTILCDKGHLKEIHPSIGAFCDATRDAVKGSVMDERGNGFVSGGPFSAGHLACCVKGWSGESQDMIYRSPMQTISYLSCHDDWTLWDKLIATMTNGMEHTQLHPAVLRANRLAAAMLFCCQGHLFFLSGEEFARTKLGVKNSYRSPVALNRLDWQRAADCAALVEYYRGLIALRKRLPGLCDKSILAPERLFAASDVAPGAAMIQLDNRGENSEYDTLCLLFNTSDRDVPVSLPEGEWQLLADGESSWFFESGMTLSGKATIEPASCLILGK